MTGKMNNSTYFQPTHITDDIRPAHHSDNFFRIFTLPHENKELNYDAAYELDFVNGTFEWYGDIYKQLGYSQTELPVTIDDWIKIIHPDDRENVKEAIHQHLKTNARYLKKYRIRKKDQTFAFVGDYGTSMRNSSFTPYKMIGLMKLHEED